MQYGPHNSLILGRLEDLYLFYMPGKDEHVTAVWDGISNSWYWGHYYPDIDNDEATRRLISRYLDRTDEVIYKP